MRDAEESHDCEAKYTFRQENPNGPAKTSDIYVSRLTTNPNSLPLPILIIATS